MPLALPSSSGNHLPGVAATQTQLMTTAPAVLSTAVLGEAEAENVLSTQGSWCFDTGNAICLPRALSHAQKLRITVLIGEMTDIQGEGDRIVLLLLT